MGAGVALEKIRFSITRLKLWGCCFVSVLCGAWKDKILDSEIETHVWVAALSPGFSWKDKILDSEIETSARSAVMSRMRLAWKDKLLDYEIETIGTAWSVCSHTQTWKDKILDSEIETSTTGAHT